MCPEHIANAARVPIRGDRRAERDEARAADRGGRSERRQRLDLRRSRIGKIHCRAALAALLPKMHVTAECGARRKKKRDQERARAGARASAARDERDTVPDEDTALAARLVFGPRATLLPAEPQQEDKEPAPPS